MRNTCRKHNKCVSRRVASRGGLLPCERLGQRALGYVASCVAFVAFSENAKNPRGLDPNSRLHSRRAVLCCVVLSGVLLCGVVLYCVVFCCVALCYVVLCCVRVVSFWVTFLVSFLVHVLHHLGHRFASRFLLAFGTSPSS